jgi:osmotically-inducible protein OsmY
MKLLKHPFLHKCVLIACLTASVSACAPILMGGALMGSFVATDRRTSGAQLEDESIELRAAKRIWDNLGDRVHVNITSYNRQVLITGEVPNFQEREVVEQIVAKIENVRSTVNELAVLGNTGLTQRSSDVIVSTRVRAGLVDARDLFANAFKVVTMRGTTYIMGRVTQREANRATEVVRSTPGVQKVVRLLEIISEEELQALSLKPAP